MHNKLFSRELIAVARCLTGFQSDITDYELEHYAILNNAQRAEIEKTITLLATTAGSLYAYSVQLEFSELRLQIQKMKDANESLNQFLHRVQKIQQVLDIVETVAALADAVMNQDVESITLEIDKIIRMTGKD